MFWHIEVVFLQQIGRSLESAIVTQYGAQQRLFHFCVVRGLADRHVKGGWRHLLFSHYPVPERSESPS